MENVSALYVRKNSIYKTLGIDSWDEIRDARLYPGGNPIVAHPPCAQWSRLRGLAKQNKEVKDLAILAVKQVRLYAGVLEHPVSSILWSECDLPRPGQTDNFGGYTICVDQHWFGHRAKKTTFLYICGCSRRNLPPISYSLDMIEAVVGSSTRRSNNHCTERMHSKEREQTPEKFALFLLEIARRSQPY